MNTAGEPGFCWQHLYLAGESRKQGGLKSLFQDWTSTFSLLASDHWRFCLVSASSHLILISSSQGRSSPASKVVVSTQRIPCLADVTIFHMIIIIVTVIYHVKDTPVQMLWILWTLIIFKPVTYPKWNVRSTGVFSDYWRNKTEQKEKNTPQTHNHRRKLQCPVLGFQCSVK